MLTRNGGGVNCFGNIMASWHVCPGFVHPATEMRSDERLGFPCIQREGKTLMTIPPIDHATIVFERSLEAAPEDVFAAWSGREALLDWSAPGDGWDMAYRAFEFRTGHTDVLTFGPAGAAPYVNEVHYHAIRADTFILYSSTVSHENGLLFAGTVLLELTPAAGGTDLRVTETGFYVDGDSPEGHKEGWAAMLDGLAAYLGRPAAA